MRRTLVLLAASSLVFGCAVDEDVGPVDDDTTEGVMPSITDGGASTGVGSGGGTGPGGNLPGSSNGTGGVGGATGSTASTGTGMQGGIAGGGLPSVGGTTGWNPAATAGGADGSVPAAPGGSSTNGSGDAGIGAGGMTGTGGATGDASGNSGDCPAGFQSELALVMTGDAVPGSVELGLASSPETPRAPCGLPKDQDCFNRLNAERAAAGLAPLKWDGDLADVARSHAADRSQRRYPGSQHGSSTNAAHLYEQRAQFLGLKDSKFSSVVENAVTGASSAAAAVGSWMSSSGHAAVILGSGAWSVYTYAGCAGEGREWNIEFGRQRGGLGSGRN